MKPKQIEIILAIVAVLLCAGVPAKAIYINDGQNHVFSGPSFYLDIAGPGTNAQVVDGAALQFLGVSAYATAQIDGGLILQGMNVVTNARATVNGGTIGGLKAYAQGFIELNGGTISYTGDISSGNITSADNSIINIRGGTFDGLIIDGITTMYGGLIYLYGDNFSAAGQQLNYGDNLRDFGVTDEFGNLTGTLNGTLADGSSFTSTFFIRNYVEGGDIIVVPEPATLLLLSAAFAASRFLRSRG
jgi:hypothetical protein